MNLKVLYEIKERLNYNMVAGLSLLNEDFRLKKGIEELESLAKVNPVFAKIKSSLEQLFLLEGEKKTELLLDVMALLDAVLYTQGTVKISGELEEIEVFPAGMIKELHYRDLEKVLWALTTTGSGRYEVIEEFRKEREEDFKDYRILYALIDGLEDGYTELADKIQEILSSFGEEIVPILKKGFQPDGNSGMRRRVFLISNIRKEKENDWYREMLKTAKRGVKEALLYALQYSKENEEYLLELYKKERGNNKRIILEVLAQFDTKSCQ